MGNAEKVKCVALVTDRNWPNLSTDSHIGDDLLRAHLITCGVHVRVVVWNDPTVPWTEFDCAVLRSTWDYSSNVAEFKGWLDKMKREGVKLFNPVDVIQWNMDKTYLRNLEHKGVRIPNSVFLNGGEGFNVREIMQNKGWSRCFIKPTVGCDSLDTFFIQTVQEAVDKQKELEQVFSGRDFIVQEYLTGIRYGEWSLCYFGNIFSHAILAQPNNGHFLSRSKPYEFSGCEPPRAVMEAGNKVINSTPFKEFLYGRVDLVQMENGDVVLIELELIEPSLYLSAHPLAPKNFSDQIIKKLC